MPQMAGAAVAPSSRETHVCCTLGTGAVKPVFYDPARSSVLSLVARWACVFAMSHWLIKSEPEVFSIADLARVRREPWSGVRNYQARNFMWKVMQPDELALFYHSNANPPGIVGIARVCSQPYPDPTQFDPASEYFDNKATSEHPRWWLVDFEYVATLSRMLTLTELKTDPELAAMTVCQRGSRLSIHPVAAHHFARVSQLAGWDGVTRKIPIPPPPQTISVA